MFARPANRNVVLAAAAALTGVGAAVALAQESPPDLASYLARCASVKDPNLQVGCQGEQALKHAQDSAAFHGKRADAADKRIAATDERIADSEKRTAALKQDAAATGDRIAALQTEAGCQETLITGLGGPNGAGPKRFRTEDVIAALAGRPIEGNACDALRRIEQLRR